MKRLYALIAFSIILTSSVVAQTKETVFAGPLKVKASLHNDQVTLTWKKVKGFEDQTVQLERSSNGLTFEPMGDELKFGQEKAIDQSPGVGFNYYRLTTKDNTDGQIRLSEINLIYVPGNFNPSCLAEGKSDEKDPFSSTFSLSDTCTADSLTMLVPVYDINGNKVDIPVTVDPNKGGGQLYIDPSNNLLPGIYTVGGNE